MQFDINKNENQLEKGSVILHLLIFLTMSFEESQIMLKKKLNLIMKALNLYNFYNFQCLAVFLVFLKISNV